MSEAFDKVSGTLGFVGDVIGLGGTLLDTLFPPPPAADLNNFRIHVGELDKIDDTEEEQEFRSIGGNAPAIAGWSSFGDFLSQDTPTGVDVQKIARGEFRDYSIEGRQQIDYLSVVRTGNDAVCIHLITGQSANTGRKFAWNGDLGKACGAPWYPQSSAVTDRVDGSAYRPACVWIDGNDDIEPGFKGFNLNLGSFAGDLSDESNKALSEYWNANRDLLCKSEPTFSMYTDIEIGMQPRVFRTSPTEFTFGDPRRDNAVLNRDNWRLGELPAPGLLPQKPSGKSLVPSFICTEEECPPSGGSFEMDLEVGEFQRRSSATSEKRNRFTQPRREQLDRRDQLVSALHKRQARHADRLVISKIEEHSAVELCNSVTSLGPDLVSMAEGMYCDMQEKRLWPVCSYNDSDAGYCFDMETNSIRGTGDNGIAASVQVENGENARGFDFNLPVKAYRDVSTWEA